MRYNNVPVVPFFKPKNKRRKFIECKVWLKKYKESCIAGEVNTEQIYDKPVYQDIAKYAIVIGSCVHESMDGVSYSYNINTYFHMAQAQLKEGSVMTYQVLQNTTTYQLRIASTSKGLWACIQQSGVAWKLTITNEMVQQTVAKASNGKETLTLKEFISVLLQAVAKSTERWSLGIMTPIELQVLRGGQASKQASNNKIYMILSDKEKKLHYPFTFIMNEIGEKDKLIEAIKTMKGQLEELRAERADKSQSSFSILNETLGTAQQLKMENQEMKRKIRIYEQSLTQKRGAVEIDIILKEKNNLELQAQNKKREQAKEIARLKNIYQLIDREIAQITNEVELINRELIMLEDSVGNSAKLKSHALKVLKSYENELRTQKKVLQKQVKEIQNLKRNIQSSKNNERKVLAKIKQIQTEIDQSKKKANIKQISNRLHSVGKGKGSSVDSPSSKSQSVASSTGKPQSQTSGKGPTNLVRDNLIRKNAPTSSSNRNNLLKTSPNINLNHESYKKSSGDKIPGRAVNSSHQVPKTSANTNPRLFNTQKYNRSASKSENENLSQKSESLEKKQPSKEDREKQRKAMQRLTGARNNIPKAPSMEKDRLFKKSQPNNRNTSQQKPGSVAAKGVSGSSVKKDSAKQMLQKMKEIKAQYNNRSKNAETNKNIANKITEVTDKRMP